MDRKELISSPAYWLAQFQIDFFRIVKEYQLINDLDKWQLQSELDISEYTLNQILSGDAYLTFNEICNLSVKMNKAPKLTFVDLTPSNLFIAFSTLAEQAEQVMPVTLNFSFI